MGLYTYDMCDRYGGYEDECGLMSPPASMLIPCEICFKEYYDALEKINGLDVYKPMELFRWSWQLHNNVNKKLGKREIEYEEAVLMYCVKQKT
jgi:hypothetical protein